MISRSSIRTALLAATVLASGSASAERGAPSPAAARANPDTLRIEATRRARAVKASSQQKVLTALQADARYAALQTELGEASRITDVAAQSRALRDIATRGQAMRDGAVRKAGIDLTALAPQVIEARTPPPPALPHPFKPPALPIGTASPPAAAAPTVVTAFTEIDVRKSDCPDAGDTWSFPNIGSHFDISSSPLPGDHDCGWLRSSKGAFVNVPPGTKHVAFTVKLDFSLKTLAASVGIYAEAHAEVGVRIENVNGTPIDETKVGSVSIPTAVSFCWVSPVDSKQVAVGFVPFEDSGNQGLDSTIKCAFDVDPQGGPMVITPYVGGSVDADLSGYARSFGTVTPHSVSAVFSK